jgi:hypothetical protein
MQKYLQEMGINEMKVGATVHREVGWGVDGNAQLLCTTLTVFNPGVM